MNPIDLVDDLDVPMVAGAGSPIVLGALIAVIVRLP